PESHAGDQVELDIGPFDVINLETEGFNADFTNSEVDATQPVGVFVGSEASDAPTYTNYAARQCCADHLEEQLIPDSALGLNFVVAHQPSRTHALNQASADGQPLVAEGDEPEWVRIVALSGDPTHIMTTLPSPDDNFMLDQHNDVILKTTTDFQIKADRPVSVVDVLASQEVTGIPSTYPGGDPSLIVVPPSEQYRRDYVFLTPDTYAFNFVEIVAQKGANILLDGASLSDTGCTSSDVPELAGSDANATAWVTYGCQLSFPTVTRGPHVTVSPGTRNTGAHSLVSDTPIGIVVSGFDSFVGYAYVGGLNLDVLN
ncbi:MAG TPA: IgGFc-binding protein, partial [Polyangiales bacterium]